MVFDANGAGIPPGSVRLSAEVGQHLRRRGLSLAVAESCTGGLLGGYLTAVAGSSDYFLGGVIAYSNAVKVAVLGVHPRTLDHPGAVSAQCAAEMAAGVRRLVQADLALALTGVAGPGGGTPEKPVGLVYVGLAGAAGTRVRELHLTGSRTRIRQAAAGEALAWLCRELVCGPEEISSDGLIPP